MESLSIYLHIPFCRHRCGYCDFNTYAGLDDLIPNYVSALCREVELLRQSAGQRLPAHTIFFGGGTPSLLPLNEMERILKALENHFELDPQIEITLEANPGTVSQKYLSGLRSLGVNRISLGVQSANPFELQFLERQHSFLDVIEAVKAARQAGLHNLNLDLIFGLPEQDLITWQQSVELVLGLDPEHLSLYSLTLEHGTPLARWAARGLVSEPDPDMAAEMYEWASERLEQAGYRQYEISNWARMDESGKLYTCRHNLQYWHNRPYVGLGAGAHGFAGGVRTANVLSPAAYISRCLSGETKTFPCTPATQSAQSIDRQAEIGETMMMGLRLIEEGVPADGFRERFGEGVEQIFPSQIEQLIRQKLLEWGGENKKSLRLTKAGRLLGNRVFMEFV